jgi:DNA (cytosine-5)-methyltransferase 1
VGSAVRRLAGCLRTASGGSSRQFLLFVEGDLVRSRLLSPREAARLMGLNDDYKLPVNINEALSVVGDGVAVPAVRFLAENILEQIFRAQDVRMTHRILVA